ncbi:hypothetical protein [Microbacterium sp. SLBN-111]|uniref:hypothetical protein n=1 Tax=Microbacterium sp. SLBN-111 TaxID=3377733 RepID=UPI003C766B63
MIQARVGGPDLAAIYETWVQALDVAVMQHDRFTVRDGSDLLRDADALRGVEHIQTIQKGIQTAAFQLLAAVEMHEVWKPRSAVPALARAALETAATAAWTLFPTNPARRLERCVSLQLQNNYDEQQFRGAGWQSEYSRRRTKLLTTADTLSIPRSRFKSFSMTKVMSDVSGELNIPGLSPLWSLLSGLSHGRHWAIHEAAGSPTDFLPATRVLSVPREAFGRHQLHVAAVLDAAVALWNERSGNTGVSAMPLVGVSVDVLLHGHYPAREPHSDTARP